MEKTGTINADAPEKKNKQKIVNARQKERKLDAKVEAQLVSHGRVLAAIASRPGQSGRCDGYILEGKELEFYQKALQAKKGKKATA